MKHGDFIKIDFVGKVVGTGEIFDFTSEEVAKKQGLHNPKHQYGPALVIMGAKMVIPGVEKHLLDMEEGEEKEFTVPPEEAFGPRNPHLIKIFPLFTFLREKVTPSPGSFVDIESMRGKVQSVSGGRVRVDFNHPLAGKELAYWMKIVQVITKPEEKVAELFFYYGLKYTFTLEEGVLTIESKEEIPHEARDFIREAVGKWVKEVKSIHFPEKKEKP